MAMSIVVHVHDPVDPRELITAALEAVRKPNAVWHQYFWGEVTMFQAWPDQGADALASVHFAADGGLLPPEMPEDPPCYAAVGFNAGSSGTHEDGQRYATPIVERLGAWLAERDLDWSAQFEGEPWLTGSPRTRPGS